MFFRYSISLILALLLPLSALAQPTPPSNPLRIGNTVVGGTATRVLYVDSSGKLANDGDFTWNDSANILQIVGSVDGTFSQFANGYIGVFDGSAQGPQIVIPDFYASGTSGLYYYNGSGNAIATYNSNTSGWAFGPNYTSTSSANTFEQSTVFNEAGAAVNTRIESDTNANMLYVNGASNGVIIGGTSVLGSSALTLNGDMYVAAGSNNKINFDRTNTTSYGRLLFLTGGVEAFGLGQRGDSGADYLTLTGPSANSFPTIFTIIPGSGAVPSNASTFNLSTAANPSHTFTMNGATVLNEQGNAVNTRMESDTNANLFYLDGTNNKIVIGSNTSNGTGPLNVTGTDATLSLQATSATNWSGFNVYDNANALSASFQYGNASASAFANQMIFAARKNTTPVIFYTVGAGGITDYKEGLRLAANGGEVVVNDGSTGTVDFRVEGDTNTNLFQVYAGAETIGVNANGTDISNAGGGKFTVKTDTVTAFANTSSFVAPSNTTANNRTCFNIGVTNSANNLNSFCFKYAGSGSTNNSFDVFFSFASTPAFQVSAANKAGINIGAGPATSYLDVQGTTEQLRLLYDGSNYLSTTVSSAGAVTWDAVGASAGFTFSDSVTIADTKNIIINTSTGTKIGTGTTQKIGFWNATPVAQQAGTGETVGFTAGAGTNVTDASTFTGNVGSTAYRISDIVKALKNIGALAQ